MTDHSAAIDTLARQAVSDCIREHVHRHVTVRRLPKAEVDAIRDRAREIQVELRPTADAYELAYDVLMHGGVG